MGEVDVTTVQLLDPIPVANGFTQRYDAVEAALAARGTLRRLTLGPPGSGASIVVPSEVFQVDRRGRLQRARAALGLGGPVAAASKALDAACAGSRAVALLTYRHPELAGRCAAHRPTWMFVEERPVGTHARPTRRARVLATLERSALRRLLGPVRSVVVIAPHEAPAAARRWNRPVVVVPHTIDAEAVATTTPLAATEPGAVLVVGNLADPRNAEGLRVILDALDETPGAETLTVSLVSATPLGIQPVTRVVRVLERGPIEDLAPLYDAARVVLVPAFEAWGVKTTILQGWAARRPVVTTTSSAATVGEAGAAAVASGATPAAVASTLVAVATHLDRAEALVARGTTVLASEFSETALRRALDDLLDGAA